MRAWGLSDLWAGWGGFIRSVGHISVLGATAITLAACSSVARFEEPHSFRFDDRGRGASASGSAYSDNYEYRGGRDPRTGTAPARLATPPSGSQAYGGNHQAYSNGDQGGYGRGDAYAGERSGYDGRQTYHYQGREYGYASAAPHQVEGGGFQPSSGTYNAYNSPSVPHSVGMAPLPPAQHDTYSGYPPPRAY